MHRAPETSPLPWLGHRRRHFRRRRVVRRSVFGVAVLLLAFAGWGVFEGAQALRHLRATERAIDRVAAVAQSPSTDSSTIDAAIDDAQTQARLAESAVWSLPWRVGMVVPGIRTPLQSVRDIVRAVDTVADHVLPAARQSTELLAPSGLRTSDGRIRLDTLVQAQPRLREARNAAALATQQLRAAPRSGIGAIDRRSSALQATTQRATATLDSAVTATEAIPLVLGAEGPRTYLLAFQNPAEARGTGGLIGGYMIVRADEGRLRLLRTVPDVGNRDVATLDLGPDFTALYGEYHSGGLWQNANISPHFPYAARIWRDLYRRQTGVTVDGVIAIDPITLSYLLPAIGPVTLATGETVTADSVVRLTESDAYATYADRRDPRKRYLASIAEQTFRRLTGPGTIGTWEVVQALGRAAGEGRLSMWSADPRVQTRIAETSLAHAVPYSPDELHHVVITNSAASKLDYYLHRDVVITRSRCGDSQRTTVQVSLTSDAPTRGLDPYVTGSDWAAGRGTPMTVSLYTTWGARLTGLTIDGRRVSVGQGRELGHPVFYTLARVYPGRTTMVRFDIDESVMPGDETLPEQPLTRPTSTTTRDVACRGR